MWEDIVQRKIYVTGGVGSTGNEGFGEPYVLPNISAYAETCAVLMFATLNHRLFLLTGDSQYIDVLERGLYNNALSGVSPSGDRFFYVNRLASAGDGRDTRWERASLECCPPNLVRFLASMPGYIYAQDGRGAIYVNLYVSSDAKFRIGDTAVGLQIESGMPWSGKTTILASASKPIRTVVKLRIPGWARNRVAPGSLYWYSLPGRSSDGAKAGAAVSINGRSVNAAPDAKGYVSLDREWRSGDRIELEFPFEVRKITADDRVRDTRGRVAIERGPIVYCVEDGRALDVQLDPTSLLRSYVETGPNFAPSKPRRGRLGNDYGRSEEHVESLRGGSAHHADSVLHLGEPRSRGDVGVDSRSRLRPRRHRPGGRTHLPCQPELRS